MRRRLQSKLIRVFFQGAIFGLVAYGTYNLTNMATIKNWSPTVVFVDMLWGALLTGTSVFLGVYLTKKIKQLGYFLYYELSHVLSLFSFCLYDIFQVLILYPFENINDANDEKITEQRMLIPNDNS